MPKLIRTSAMLTLCLFASLLSPAFAHLGEARAAADLPASAPTFSNADLAGVWAGSATGTFGTTAFATNVTIHADRHGHLDITIQSTIEPPNHNSCEVTILASGLGSGTCNTGNSTVAPNVEYSVGLVLTDRGRELRFYQSAPGLLSSGSARRQ